MKHSTLYAMFEEGELQTMLPQRIEEGYIKSKPTHIPGLNILKYNPGKTMFKGHWDKYITQAARGNIVDKDFNPINMPFPKMFNRGELGLDFNRDEEVIAWRKRNGFMLDVFYHEGKVIVGTTGSTDSKYAEMGRKYVTPWVEKVISDHPGHTFTFEICDPEDPHIIPEPVGIYLLGIRAHDWNGSFNLLNLPTDVFPDQLIKDLQSASPVQFDQPIIGRFSDIAKMAKDCDHEGYVIWSNDAHIGYVPLKIKSDNYLIKKLLARSKPEQILAKIKAGKAKTEDNEEYWPLFEHIENNLVEFQALEEQPRIRFIERFLGENNLKV